MVGKNQAAPAFVRLRGQVHGGQQPIAGATMQLYAAGTSADQSAALPLIASVIQSGTDGSFSITGSYTCPSSDAPVYLTASGGNPGEAAGTNNQASVLMASLGSCGALSANTFIVINEVTTVASVYPIPQFMSSYTFVGASPADQALFVDQFARANQFVNISTGTSPGLAVPSGYSVPTAELYSLANSLAACVNSAGGAAGDGSPCGSLFALATPPGGPAPTNTTDAALDIIAHPARNTAALFSLASPSAPFQPSLSAAPADWTLRISPNAPFALPERAALLGEYLLSEGSGNVAHDSSGLGNDSIITGPAWAWEGTSDLTFTNEGNAISVPVDLNATKTWQFAVYNPPEGLNQLPQAPGFGYPQGNFGQNPSLLCGTDTAHLCLIANSYYNGLSQRLFAFNTDSTESAQVFPIGWHVVTFICGGASGPNVVKTHILYDGVEVSGYITQGDVTTCPNPTGGNYQIGGSAQYTGTYFTGKIAAAWSWSVPLTVGEGAQAAAAAMQLIRSRGIQIVFQNLPASQTPLLITGVDSRTTGFGVTPETLWVNAMQLTDSTYTRVNYARTHELVFDVCNQFEYTYGELIGSASVPTIVVIWGGTNDYGPVPYPVVAASLQCIARKTKAAGARIVLATELGRYAGTIYDGDPAKRAIDTILRANALNWGVDNLADLASDPMLGADGATANTACFQDGLHPSIACEARVTTIMQNAVNELLGSSASSHNATSVQAYQEVAGDDFLDLSGTAAQTVTLPSCIGYSRPRQIANGGSSSASLATLNGETLSGSAVIAPGATALVAPVPGPYSTGGCSWTRTQ